MAMKTSAQTAMALVGFDSKGIVYGLERGYFEKMAELLPFEKDFDRAET